MSTSILFQNDFWHQDVCLSLSTKDRGFSSFSLSGTNIIPLIFGHVHSVSRCRHTKIKKTETYLNNVLYPQSLKLYFYIHCLIIILSDLQIVYNEKCVSFNLYYYKFLMMLYFLTNIWWHKNVFLKL